MHPQIRSCTKMKTDLYHFLTQLRFFSSFLALLEKLPECSCVATDKKYTLKRLYKFVKGVVNQLADRKKVVSGVVLIGRYDCMNHQQIWYSYENIANASSRLLVVTIRHADDSFLYNLTNSVVEGFAGKC